MIPTALFVAGCASHSSGTYPPSRLHNAQEVLALYGAWQQYISAHNRYPDASRWEVELRPYWQGGKTPFDMQLETAPGQPPQRLAMNAALSKRPLSAASSDTVIFYETPGTVPDAHGKPPALDVLMKPCMARSDNPTWYLTGDGGPPCHNEY